MNRGVDECQDVRYFFTAVCEMTTAIRDTIDSRGAKERVTLAKYRGGEKPRFYAVLRPRFDPIVTHFYQSALIHLAVSRGFLQGHRACTVWNPGGTENTAVDPGFPPNIFPWVVHIMQKQMLNAIQSYN